MALEALHITLPPVLKQFVEQRVAEGGFEGPSEYFGELVRYDQERHSSNAAFWEQVKRQHEAATFHSQEQLEALLLEGIESLKEGRLGPDDGEEFAAQLIREIDALPPRC